MDETDAPAQYSIYDRSDKYTDVSNCGWTPNEEYQSLYYSIWQVRRDLEYCDRLMARPRSAASLEERDYEQRYIEGTAAATRSAISRFYTTLREFGVLQQSFSGAATSHSDQHLGSLRDVLQCQRSEVETCHKSLSIAIAKLNISPTSITQTINVVTPGGMTSSPNDLDLSILEARKRKHRRLKSRRSELDNEIEEQREEDKRASEMPMLEQRTSVQSLVSERPHSASIDTLPELYELPGDTIYNSRPRVTEEFEQMRKDYIPYRRHPSVLQISKERSEARRSMVDLRESPLSLLPHKSKNPSLVNTKCGVPQVPNFAYTQPTPVISTAVRCVGESIPPAPSIVSALRERASSLPKLSNSDCTVVRRTSCKPQPLPPLPRYYTLNPLVVSNDITALPSQRKFDALPYPPTLIRQHVAPLPAPDSAIVQALADGDQRTEARDRRHTAPSILDGKKSAQSLGPCVYPVPDVASVSLKNRTEMAGKLRNERNSRYVSRLDPFPARQNVSAAPQCARISEDNLIEGSKDNATYDVYQQRPYSSLSVDQLDSQPSSLHNPTLTSASASASTYSLLPEMVSIELLRHESGSSKVVRSVGEPEWTLEPDSWLTADTTISDRGSWPARVEVSTASAARRQRDKRKAMIRILEEVV